MNKINENENKNKLPSFNERIAMYNKKANIQNSQKNESNDKMMPETKKEKNILNNNENYDNKEKPKEGSNILNIINQFNKIESDKKELNKGKKEINSTKINEIKEEKFNINNKIKEKEININKDKKEENKVSFNEKQIEKINEEEKNKNLKINNNDIIQKEPNNSFKNKINIFNKDKDEKQNISKNDTLNFNNDEKFNKNLNTRGRSFTIQERIKAMNIKQKEVKENNDFNKNKQIPKILEEKEDDQIEEINKIPEVKISNSIHHRATVFSKNIKKEVVEQDKTKNTFSDKKIITDEIQKKIQNLQNQNIEKKNNKNEIFGGSKKVKNNFEPSIIDKLKAIYQPKNKENKKDNDKELKQDDNINKTNKKYNNNENIKLFESEIKTEIKDNNSNNISSQKIQQKEIKNEQYITPIKDIKEEISNNNMSDNSNIPKKLDLNKIFKNMNIEQVASIVKENKRLEIIKFAQQQKESDSKQNESDSDSNEGENEIEENEKEEEVEKNIVDDFYPLEMIPDEDEENKVLNTGENLEKSEKKKINILNKIKNKFTFHFKKSSIDTDIKFDEKNSSNSKNPQTLKEDRNTFSNQELEKHLILKQDEITKKMRKTMVLPDKKPKNEIIEDDTFLPSKLISQKDYKSKGDTFCESFFLASFSKDNGKVMENSDFNQPECNHKTCNILPAMQPEIIYKYPKEDIKGLEINNLAASICFPNGIKLCYEEKEENIKTVKNYRSSFTNQVGDRFFAVTYHFYLKKKNRDFESSQNITPIQYEIAKYQDELRAILNDEQDEDIFAKLTVLGELSKREYVYIPYCLCLISKYPFIEQMEKCLESILLAINNPKLDIEDLNKYISYIVSSIPAPPVHSKIFFSLPYFHKLVEIKTPYFRDIVQFGDNPIILLQYISEKNIVTLFKLLIFEQKLLILGKDNDLISQIISNFVSLLYPFEWIHTFIPIMSEKMMKFLQAFLPFFNGMNIALLEKAKPILAQAAKGVYIYNIDENNIEINNNYKRNSKNVNVSSYINRHIPKIPKNLEQLILKELKLIKADLSKQKNKTESDLLNLNLRMKNVFMQFFTELLYDYKKYSYIIDDYPVFNSFLLIKEKEKKGSNFYAEFTSTQIFQMFIQNSLFPNDDKKSYFEDRLSYLEEIKKSGANLSYNSEKLYQKLNEDYNKYFEVKKKYVIKPFFIKEFNILEEKKSAKNQKVNMSDIIRILSKHYSKQNFTILNKHGVLFENKRVIKQDIELTNDNDPQEIMIFYIHNIVNDNNNINNEDKSEENNSIINKDNSASKIKKVKTIKMGIISKEEDIKKNNIKISQALPNKEYELSEDEIDEIKDNIREIMTRVYRSDVNKIKEDKKTLIDSLKTRFGRDYFTNILNNGYKQDYLIKNLVNKSYYFLYDVIFNTLLDILKLEENDDNILCAVKLLKSCQYIGTVNNKKEFLVNHNSTNILSDELYNNLENYSLFEKLRFWECWVEDDMTESELNIKESKKCEDNIIDEESEEYLAYVKHSYALIDNLTHIMMKMKIRNNSIYSHIFALSGEYLMEDIQIKQIREEAFNELELFKKISNS